ncbi:MAG: SDR family oxidoreductase [Phycisphaerae bacterium]
MTQRWLITGASGQLGGHVVRLLAGEAHPPTILSVSQRTPPAEFGAGVAHCDLADDGATRALVRDFRPTHLIHSGAMTAVGDCFASPERARLINTVAAHAIAQECAALHARMVFVSTDMVFGGDRAPYREGDPPAPLSVYGRTKADAETAIRDIAGVLVARVPLMYGFACTSRSATFAAQIAAIRARTPLKLFTDEFRTPAWVVDAARALIGLARSNRTGIIHLAGPERLSRIDMARRFAEQLGIADPAFEPTSRLNVPGEPRPADLSLDASRLTQEFPHLICGPIRAEAFVH